MPQFRRHTITDVEMIRHTMLATRFAVCYADRQTTDLARPSYA